MSVDSMQTRRGFLSTCGQLVAGLSIARSVAASEEGRPATRQTFKREAIKTHYTGPEYSPEFLGTVNLGESFVIETENSNDANGPIEVAGVKSGDDIVVRIEHIEMVPPIVSPNGGPFIGLSGSELELRDGYFYFPDHFRIKPRPTIGNVAVLPAKPEEYVAKWAGIRGYRLYNWRGLVNDPRDKHCHQDCPYLGPGAAIHLKAQIDGAGLCMADFHAYMGEEEMSFNGVSCAANILARVERSTGWLVDWPLVETPDEIMVCVNGDEYVPVVREAFRACREVVAVKAGCSIEEANNLVASIMDLRNSAIYGLRDGYTPGTEGEPSVDLAVMAVIPKAVFV